VKLLNLIWKLLTDTEKKKYYLHIFFSIIQTFFETVLVALVVPLTQIIMKEKVNFFFINNIDFIEKLSYEQQVLFALSSLAIIYLIKNGFFLFFLWWQHNYIANFETRIVKKLFSTYIFQSYPYHLSKSSGILINKINLEVGSFNSTLRAICQISSESLVLIAITTCLLIYEPKGTLIVVVFSFAIFVLANFFLKNKVRKWGANRFYYYGLSNRELIQSLEGIKEIKVMGLERKIISYFFENISKAIYWRTKWEITAGIPRIIFELIAVLSFCLLTFAIFKISNNANFVEITALFLAATFRLMPSLTRITGAYTTFQNQYTPVSSIINDLNLKTNIPELEKQNNKLKFNFKEKIEFKDVSFRHVNSEKMTINNITFSIKKGQIVGVIGTSGSGKTTLADVLIGLLDKLEGEIYVDDLKLNNGNIKSWQKKIGYVPQTIFLSDDTIKGNIAYGIENEKIDLNKINQCIKMSNLENFIKETQHGIDTIIGERGVRISGGQRQRLAIARTLYQDPELIIFDEATSALDPKNEAEIISNIVSLRGEKTIIIIAHKFSLIKDCDNILVLDDGKLIKQGKYNDIF